jgi:DNA-binding response OmpR family regulator
MKKILIFRELKSLFHVEKNLFKRADFQLFTAPSAKDIIKTHRTEQVDLIVLQLDMDGMRAEDICSFLREEEALKNVSILIICDNTKAELARAEKCKANSYVTRSVLQEHLMQKVGQLLAIPERQDYRVLLKVTIKSTTNNTSFFCSSYNISVTGMLIETERVFAKSDIISCSFFLPNSGQIITDAMIMRVMASGNNTFQYGIRYVNMEPRYQGVIDAFVKRRSGKT